MGILQWFCNHNWISHSKEKYEWKEEKIVKGTEHWLYPKFELQEVSETVEVLICKDCGKIKTIEY